MPSARSGLQQEDIEGGGGGEEEEGDEEEDKKKKRNVDNDLILIEPFTCRAG